MRLKEVLEKAIEKEINPQEALYLFENTDSPQGYLPLFKAACSVRQKEMGNVFRLDGFVGSSIECKIDPPCQYCWRTISHRKWEVLKIQTEKIPQIAEAFKKTGTTTIEIGGGTDPEKSGPVVIELLRHFKKSGLNVWVNVGPALEEEHIREMKRLGVEAITSSFETMNEEIFSRVKPGDSLKKRKELAELIGKNGVGLFSVLMAGLGESYNDRVAHLFYLKKFENFRRLSITCLKVFPGSPLEGKMLSASLLEGARTMAIARLIFRNIYISAGGGPQNIPLWVMSGVNRMTHAGATLNRKGHSRFASLWPLSGAERLEAGDGYEILNFLPVSTRYVRDAGMDIEPSILKAATSAV